MIYQIEQLIVNLLLNFMSVEQLNAFADSPQAVAIVVGSMIAIAAAIPGVFLVLRRMTMVSDAISHTVLFGIVVVVLIMLSAGMGFDLANPLLLFGAAAAGVLTVALTELILNSGLVKADAALGLAFPFLFALAIILISLFVDDAHLDSDAVMVGEIGVAWANTNSHCFENCEEVVITPEDERAEVGRRCVNCEPGGITPFSPDAEFEETCSNCGTYTAGEAWAERLISEPPLSVAFPKAITVLLLVTLLNIAFVVLLYKELKLSTFDSGLAAASGFRPGVLHYGLMILVSLTSVAAFDAVGSILVVAFFAIPAATAYLLTDKLGVMLILAPAFGIAGTVTGYELSRGMLFGINLNFNTSISASMVIMLFVFFLLAWVISPRYGLVAAIVRRRTSA